MTKPRLVYFSSRGLAEFIRLLLADAAFDYDDVGVGLYNPADQPKGFTDLRDSGALDWNAIPLWEEEDGFRLAQSNSIILYLAQKLGYNGSNAHEAAKINSLSEELRDAVAAFKKAPSKEEFFKTELPKFFALFERFLKKNHNGTSFAVGDKISYADIALFYFLETFVDVQEAPGFEAYPVLQEYKKRIASRPNIAAYLVSPKRYPPQK